MRDLTRAMIAAMTPGDDAEASDLQFALEWIDSGAGIWRQGAIDVPPVHLVSYFAPVDFAARALLLADHRKAGLWLPPGGHVEPGESPLETVHREAREELGLEARPWRPEPLFLTVTETVGSLARHTDVSLWFVLKLAREETVAPDPGEFAGVRWFAWDDLPLARCEPNLTRFAARLAALDATL